MHLALTNYQKLFNNSLLEVKLPLLNAVAKKKKNPDFWTIVYLIMSSAFYNILNVTEA